MKGFDLLGTRPIYDREGVSQLWLVTPADRNLEAFELRNEHWLLVAAAKDDDVRISPFEAAEFSLGSLWP